jgi:hypothetical protein
MHTGRCARGHDTPEAESKALCGAHPRTLVGECRRTAVIRAVVSGTQCREALGDGGHRALHPSLRPSGRLGSVGARGMCVCVCVVGERGRLGVGDEGRGGETNEQHGAEE